MSRVLILGSSGSIGSELSKVNVSDQGEFDYIELVKVSRRLDQAGPSCIFFDLSKSDQYAELNFIYENDVVILLSAYSSPQLVVNDLENSYILNVIQTKDFISKVIRAKGKVIFMSSVEVFDGNFAPYSEESKPNPLNHYGRQKYEVEKFIFDNFDTNFAKIVRVPWNITLSKNAHCPVKSMYELLGKKGAKVAFDYKMSSIFINDTAKLLLKLAIEFEEISGQVIHFASNEFFSKVELANFIVAHSTNHSNQKFESVDFSSLMLKENRAKDTRIQNKKSIELFNFKYTNIWQIVEKKINLLDGLKNEII
jgi:dTDP-4-dehydrorhamnose reductase